MDIQIYDREIKDGLSEIISNNRISFASRLTIPNDQKTKEELLIKLAKASANPNQIDLVYKHSVLASVGWNINDDIFDRVETWKARNTPVDKQLNLMHNELDIIGHMTASKVYDQNGNLIPDDTPLENLPDKFDVVTEFVIYKFWQDADRRQEIQTLLSEIDNGKWFVSMECLFPKFDYALIKSDGSQHIIERNENTAFLSKYLKIYGGSGEYQGNKLGRVLRNFWFSGQGIVNDPANERSIIFNSVEPFVGKASSIITREFSMELEQKVAELATQLAAANKVIEQLQAAKKKDEEDMMHKAECALKEVETVKASLSEKDKAIAALQDELKTANEKSVALANELTAHKAEALKKARAAALAGAGVVESELEAAVAKWSSLNDEQFAEIVTIYQEKAKASRVTETVAPDLAKASVETTPVLTQPVEPVKNDMEKIASFLSTSLPYSARAQRRLTKGE